MRKFWRNKNRAREVTAISDQVFYSTDDQGQPLTQSIPDYFFMKEVLEGVLTNCGQSGVELLTTYFSKRRLYLLANIQFVHLLAIRLKSMLVSPDEKILEVCAGNGCLSRALSAQGLNMIAVDDLSWRSEQGACPEAFHFGESVIQMKGEEAMEEFRTRIVIVCFLSPQMNAKSLHRPHIRHLLQVGEGHWGQKDRQVGQMGITRKIRCLDDLSAWCCSSGMAFLNLPKEKKRPPALVMHHENLEA